MNRIAKVLRRSINPGALEWSRMVETGVRVALRFGPDGIGSSRLIVKTAAIPNNTDARHFFVRRTGKETKVSIDSSFLLYLEEANGRTIAHWYHGTYSRKVRAPVDRPPGNPWARTA